MAPPAGLGGWGWVLEQTGQPQHRRIGLKDGDAGGAFVDSGRGVCIPGFVLGGRRT